MKGRGKGSGFERDLARALSLWWTNGSRDDVFWRTAQSGGRSSARAKKGKRTFGQYGDIQATDPMGQPLLDYMTIEAKKGYNHESVFNALDQSPIAGQIHKTYWERFVEQVVESSRSAGTPSWMLIHKRDRRETMVYLPDGGMLFFCSHLLRANPSMIVTIGQRKIFCTTLEQFMSLVSPGALMQAMGLTTTPKIRIRRKR